MIQLEAALAAALVAGVAVLAQRIWAARSQARALGTRAEPGRQPRVLYFSGPHCTICRTHQEPALKELIGVPVQKIDAVEERELAERYRVFTVPTTVVISASGEALHVNYGYTPARKLQDQLAGA